MIHSKRRANNQICACFFSEGDADPCGGQRHLRRGLGDGLQRAQLIHLSLIPTLIHNMAPDRGTLLSIPGISHAGP